MNFGDLNKSSSLQNNYAIFFNDIGILSYYYYNASRLIEPY